MSAALAPFLSNSYFVEAQEKEWKIEIKLSRGMRCIVSSTNPTFAEKVRMAVWAIRLKIVDHRWESLEKDYFEVFEIWQKGDSILEEYFADNPDRYYDVSIQEILKTRRSSQQRLILIGETILSLTEAKGSRNVRNPFIDTDRIRSIVQLLKDDLENRPNAYFHELTEGGSQDGEQGSLGLAEGELQRQV